MEPVDDIIAREFANLRQFAEANAALSGKKQPVLESIQLTPLREEIVRYHARMLPYRVADIVVFWRHEAKYENSRGENGHPT